MSDRLSHLTALADHGAREEASAGRPVRVGFVLHVMQVAGAEMLVANIIHRLLGRIDPVVFCLDGVGALGTRLRGEGVEVLALGRRPGRDPRVAWRLARAARAFRIEVMHAHQYTPFFYAALARALTAGAFRLVLTEHGRAYPDNVSAQRRLANRWGLAHLADEINAVCAFSAQALTQVDGFPACRTSVIENGIHLDRYRPADDRATWKRRLSLDPARRHVTCIARFHPIKDHATLVRAFAKVAPSSPDVDLLLVGDGEQRADLKALATTLGVSGRALFLGVRGDVADVLRASDVFALTSLSEAASLTLMEAMASGLPVVVTDVGGNPEIVRAGTDGLLVPRGDDVATAEALGLLLKDPARAQAMGAAARARALERYDIERTIAAYHALYRRLAARETPA